MLYFLVGFLSAAILFAFITILSVLKVAGEADRMCIEEQSF